MNVMAYAKLKVQVSDMQEEWRKMSMCQRFFSWRLLYRLFDTQRSARYHDARNHFIKCNKLPVSFPFNKYLRRCVRHTASLADANVYRGVVAYAKDAIQGSGVPRVQCSHHRVRCYTGMSSAEVDIARQTSTGCWI